MSNEKARLDGLANKTDAAVYWIAQAQWKVIDEIDRQIKELENFIK